MSLQLNNLPTCITSMVSAMEIVGLLLWNVDPDSVVGIATRFGLDGQGIKSWWRILHTRPDRS